MTIFDSSNLEDNENWRKIADEFHFMHICVYVMYILMCVTGREDYCQKLGSESLKYVCLSKLSILYILKKTL